ncbi:MAG: hypothetical protein R3F17_16985 [Planctomycetota bacterium]
MQGGGDRSNRRAERAREPRLTIEATELYTGTWSSRRRKSNSATIIKIALHDAENTFETVVLSSEVAELHCVKAHTNFGACCNWTCPGTGLRQRQLKAEFQRLTEKMSAIN